MAGIVFAPTIVYGASSLPLPLALFSPRISGGQDFVEHPVTGANGSVIKGVARRPWRLQFGLSMQDFTGASSAARATDIRARWTAVWNLWDAGEAASNGNEFTFYLFYDAANTTGIGFDECTMVDLNADPQFIQRFSPVYYGWIDCVMTLVAQKTINWGPDAATDLTSFIDSGNTSYPAGSTPTTALSGTHEFNSLTIVNDSTGNIVARLNGDGSIEALGPWQQKTSIT